MLATGAAGWQQQRQLLERATTLAGRPLTLVPSVHPEAMAALQRGDGETHDRILLAALRPLAAQVELVLLAQASMARLVPKLPAELPAPVLASPPLAVREPRRRLAPDAQTADH